jgi:hypothetical protein
MNSLHYELRKKISDSIHEEVWEPLTRQAPLAERMPLTGDPSPTLPWVPKIRGICRDILNGSKPILEESP